MFQRIVKRAGIHRESIGVLICIIFAFLFLLSLQDKTGFVAVDLLQYWSAAVIYSEGGDPYSVRELLDMQRAVVGESLDHELPIRMYNPPLIFPIIWSLALCDFESAKKVWFALSVIAYALSVWMLSRQPMVKDIWKTNSGLFLMTLVASWYPLYLCLSYGQISCFLLFGLAISIRFARSSPYIAGLGFSLTLLKPHLLWLVYFSLLLGVRQRKCQWFIGGLTSGALALLVVAFIGNSHVFHFYWTMERGLPVHFLTPTVGSWFMSLFSEPIVILRFFPTLVFGVYFLWCHKKRHEWSFEAIAPLLPVSLLFSPYGWTFDFVLCLPSLFYIFDLAKSPIAISAAFRLLFFGNILLFLLGDSVSMSSTIWYLLLLAVFVFPFRRSSE